MSASRRIWPRSFSPPTHRPRALGAICTLPITSPALASGSILYDGAAARATEGSTSVNAITRDMPQSDLIFSPPFLSPGVSLTPVVTSLYSGDRSETVCAGRGKAFRGTEGYGG